MLANYFFFQVSFNLMIILYVAKVMKNFVIELLQIKDFLLLSSLQCILYDLALISNIRYLGDINGLVIRANLLYLIDFTRVS